MKKRIGLLLCVLALAFSFAGCGSEKDTVEYDQEVLEQYADSMIGSFSQMQEEDFAQFTEASDLEVNLTMIQARLPIEKAELVSMIGSWNAAVDECGEYVEHGGYKADADKKAVILSTEATFKNRKATIEFKFDKHLKMESMDVSAKYTTGEIMQKAGLNTVLGMGTVFAVLIFLAFIISLLKYIPMMLKKDKHTGETDGQKAVSLPAAVTETAEGAADDYELAAVIAAAIAAKEGTSADGFVVRSIKRRTSNKWNQ